MNNTLEQVKELLAVDQYMDEHLDVNGLIDFVHNNSDIFPELINATNLQVMEYFSNAHKQLMVVAQKFGLA